MAFVLRNNNLTTACMQAVYPSAITRASQAKHQLLTALYRSRNPRRTNGTNFPVNDLYLLVVFFNETFIYEVKDKIRKIKRFLGRAGSVSLK